MAVLQMAFTDLFVSPYPGYIYFTPTFNSTGSFLGPTLADILALTQKFSNHMDVSLNGG